MDSKENIDDSESIASDESEEMTEVDEFEADHRRASCVADMKDLEAKFSKLKEELINERNCMVDKKLDEIENETAEEFAVPLKKLQMNLDFKIKLTTLMRDYRWKNIEHIYECENESSKLTLQNDMQSLLEKYKSNIENEIRQLEENRRQFLLDYDLHKISQNVHEEADIPIEEDLNENEDENSYSEMFNKCKEQPYIVYSLQDCEILEDLSIIRMHNDLSRAVSTQC